MPQSRYVVSRWDAINEAQTGFIANATDVNLHWTNAGTDAIDFLLPRNDSDIANLVQGITVRVRDNVRDTDVASGRVTGVIDLGVGQDFIRVHAEGFHAALATALFPPGFIFSGDISSAVNKLRLTQSYDWRTITAKNPAGFDGDEIVSFDGDSTAETNLKVGGTNYLIWNVVESGEDTDSAAVLQVVGTTDEDGDGLNESQPYSTSAEYESPFYDFKSEIAATDEEYDRLRFDHVGQGTVTTEAATFTGSGASHTRTFAGSPASVGDPKGVGYDLTALTGHRYIAVYFKLVPGEEEQYSPLIRWFQIVSRRILGGVKAGTFPSVDIEDQVSVRGQSLLQGINAICGSNDLEWRLQVDGTLDIQTIPASGSPGGTWGATSDDEFTLVEGIHCEIEEFNQDDSELVNYLIARGTGSEEDRIECVVQDITSQTTYGLFQQIADFNEDTVEGLNAAADSWLADHKDPRKTMTIRVFKTPKNDDKFEFNPGDIIRVVSHESLNHSGAAIDETLRIVEDSRVELGGDFLIRLTLESQRRQFTSDISQQIGGLWSSTE